MAPPSEYWASLEDSDEFAKEAAARIAAYQRWYPTSIHGKYAAAAYAYKFGLPRRTGENSLGIAKDGVKGELARFRVSHWATHQNLRVTLATQQKPVWQPVPANSDAQSQSAAIAASGLLDYHYKEKRVDRLLHSAADKSQWSGAGFTLGLWDMRAGDVLAEDPETGETANEGDFRFHSLTEAEVARDFRADSFEACRWKAARVPANRWDLIEAYPDKADEIRSASSRDSSGIDADIYRDSGAGDSDQVWVWHYFHDKCPALAPGRYAILLDDTWLEDGVLDAAEVPLYRCAEGDWEGTPFGWSQIWHGLALQEVIDLLTSAITTNNLAFATQLIAVVKDDKPSYKQLTQALAMLEVKNMANLPKGFSLLATPAECYSFRDKLIQELGVISAINETTLGVVNPNMKSGSMAALYDAAAMRAANSLQRAIHQHAEDLGTFIIRKWAKSGPDAKSIAIVGEHNRPLMLSMGRADAGKIDRVSVEIVEASAKSFAARSASADALLQSGALNEANSVAAQRYMMVQKTGNLENLTEAPTRNMLRIRQACERLARGERNTIHIALTHWLDIPEKLAVLSSQEVLDNADVAGAVFAEVLEHLAAWRQMPPDLLAAMGGPQAPQMAAPVDATQPPAPGAPSGTGAPTPGAESSTGPADMPSQPAMPTAPGAEEPYDPAQGAAA